MELLKHLINHRCRDNQLLAIFDLAVQKSIFREENWPALCSVVDLERGDDCGDSGISGLCS
uniref:Uncharacterized protein n=1 Tax=Romanomermis culicivorax TaxID=13658 RepID=A0A915J8M4_ROMCU